MMMMSGKEFLKSHVLALLAKGVLRLGMCKNDFWQGIPDLFGPATGKARY